MDHKTIGVPRVNRLSFQVNLSASGVARIFVPAPIEGRAHRINWWTLDTIATSGDVIASNKSALLEGPLPDGGAQQGLNANALRDDESLHVLLESGHGGNNSTNANGLGRNMQPHFEFPRGIWTVEDVFYLYITDGGVDLLTTSIGFEVIDIGRAEWLNLRRSSPNSGVSDELIG